jgi:plastocyanin
LRGLASDPDLFRRVLTAQVKEASPVFAGCLALSGPTRARLSQDSREKPGGEAQVIEVTARKYEFAPAEIHVTKGNRVRLRVHSTDEAHGIRLNLYPEGSKDKSSPGLAFDNPQKNGKVQRAKTRCSILWRSRPGRTNSNAQGYAGCTMAG